MTNTVWANKKIEIVACYLINFRFRFKFHEKRYNNDDIESGFKKEKRWGWRVREGESSTIYSTSLRRSITKKNKSHGSFFVFRFTH